MIAFKLALRELKNNKKHWIFFSANLCIGLLGFTLIFVLNQSIQESLGGRARTLLSSDLSVSGRRDLNEQEEVKLAKYLIENDYKTTKMREVYSMAKVVGKSKKSRLVLIKAVESIYPLVGSILLNNGTELKKSGLFNPGDAASMVISREVAHQLRVEVGDTIRLGVKDFRIRGVFKTDSTSSLQGVNLAPKVYIWDKYLKETELVAFGTIAFYSRYYTFPQGADVLNLKKEFSSIITDPAIKIRTPKDSSEQLGRIIGYITNYLGMIGIVALIISCVGASYLFQSYLIDRLKQIGTLKAIGINQRQITVSFIYVMGVLGIISSLISLSLSFALMPFLEEYLKKWLTVDVNQSLSAEVFLVVFFIGVVTNLCVCLPIVRRIFKTKTVELLAEKFNQKMNFIDYLSYLPGLVLIWGVAVWQARSFIIGSIFIFAVIVIGALVLYFIPLLLKWVSIFLMKQDSFKFISLNLGYSLRVLSRNALTSTLIILSLVIGISLMGVIGQTERNLREELTGDKSVKPSLFMFDIQEHQYSELVSFAKEKNIPLKKPTPMVRARLVKINGKEVKRQEKETSFETEEQERSRRFNNRGINLTYGEGINESEKLIDGKAFSGKYSGEGLAQISLEQRYARRVKVSIGDTLTYDLLGVEIQGEVVNLRSVKWTSFLPNFFIRFQPGVIEDAPKTYLTAVDKVSFERQLNIQDLIVEKFANISMVNVTDVISKIMNIFKAMAIVVSVMSICCIFVGIFVLISILQSQMPKKRKEFAFQKIIGLQGSAMLKIFLYEYLILISIAIIFGNLFGVIISFVMSQTFFDGSFTINIEFLAMLNIFILLVTSALVFMIYFYNYSKKVNRLLLS